MVRMNPLSPTGQASPAAPALACWAAAGRGTAAGLDVGPARLRHAAARACCRVLLALGLASAAVAVSAAVTLTIDPNPAPQDQNVRLTFTSEGSVDSDPDFTPLERDFDILGQSRSSNLTFINGQLDRSQVWTLSVMPRATGTVTIPAIAFGRDRTAPAELKVLPAGTGTPAAPKLLLEVEAEPKTVFVQQQVVLKARLLRRVEISDGSLSPPSTGIADAVIDQLGKDRNYGLDRDGQHWDVIERRFAVFPQKSGPLTIDPIVFEGQVVEGTASFMDPFGNRIVTRRLRSEPIRIDVQPAPAGADRRGWLPSTRLELHEIWSDDPPVFRVGQPVTRTLALLAHGLTSSQLPALAPAPPDGLRQYPEAPVLNDQRNDDGLIALRQEKLALIPARPGHLTLPAVEVAWWNTTTGKAEVARLPAREVDVLPAPEAAAPAQPDPNASAARAAAPAPVAPVAAPAVPAPAAAPPPPAAGRDPWLLVALALALGWLLTGGAWWWQARRRAPALPARAGTGGRASLLTRDLRRACTAGDAAAARDALLAAAATRWPASPCHSLGALARRLPEEAATAVLALNAALYRPDAPRWDGGAELLRALDRVEATTTGGSTVPCRLAPLYPH